MCYTIVAHALSCDVRPLVTMTPEADKALVNPYAAPTACSCKGPDPKANPEFACEYGHKCCIMQATVLPCGDAESVDCMKTTVYHHYVRRPITRAAFNKRGPALEDEGWAPLPLIDENVPYDAFAPVETPEFVLAREKVLTSAANLYETAVQAKKLRSGGKNAEDCQAEFLLLPMRSTGAYKAVSAYYFRLAALAGKGKGRIDGLDSWATWD